jgi:hypothetical protein
LVGLSTGGSPDLAVGDQPLVSLRLVTETLLVAVLLHALFALVLVDLRFPAFFNGAHGVTVAVVLR